MPFLVTFQKLAVAKGAAKDDGDMKTKGKRMAGPMLKWLKANYDELQFFSLETYMQVRRARDAACRCAAAAAARCRSSREPPPPLPPPSPHGTRSSCLQDGSELDDKYKDIQFMANMAYVKYEGSDPWFYFCRDAYTESKF